MGAWEEESIVKALVKNFGKGREEEALTELREEIEGSLDLKKGRYSGSGDAGSFTADGDEWNIIKDIKEAERIAVDYVREQLESEPETFIQSWLQSFLSVSDTDRREMANDAADSRISDMSDEEILEEAEMTDEYEAEEDQKKKNRILDKARDVVIEPIYDEWYEGLADPISFLVEEQGIYSVEDLMKANFISIDYDKAAEDAIDVDGVGHFLSLYSGDLDEIDGDYVIFRE